jgi:drug/metabolite transporter (DMT)-like permease
MFFGLDTSICCALGSLLFAGVNDVVFKKQATSGQGRGQYIAIVGTVWMLVFAALAVLGGHFPVTFAAVKWGVLAGILSVVANYLLVASLRHLDASIGATVYRLNLVLAAVMAILFLGERLTWPKAAGLALAGLSVVLFAERRTGQGAAAGRTGALLLAVIASLLRAGMGISYKLAGAEFARLQLQGYGPQNYWFLSIQGFMWLVVGLLLSVKLEGVIKVTRLNVGYGLVSGLLCCGIVLLLALALGGGQASIIIPITQMSFLVTALLSWPLTHERFSARKIAALLLAVLAVLVLGSSS